MQRPALPPLIRRSPLASPRPTPQASYTSRLATLLRCEQSNTTEACLQLHATRRQFQRVTTLLSLLRRKLWSNRKRAARARRALLKRSPRTSEQYQVGKLLGVTHMVSMLFNTSD